MAMTKEEKDQIRKRIAAWKAASPVLERLRDESVQDADTVVAIAQLSGLFDKAVRDLPPEPTSGLIEQQEVSQRARAKSMPS